MKLRKTLLEICLDLEDFYVVTCNILLALMAKYMDTVLKWDRDAKQAGKSCLRKYISQCKNIT